MSTVFSSRALFSVYGKDEQQMLGRREGGEMTSWYNQFTTLYVTGVTLDTFITSHALHYY